ncbi:hypothetical protein MKK68_01030 [Methylobacterium sp. E-016]|uniref:hypothetical protein n=1 Tax=Methylobacterium sp. E-016 TaxID=2836556 RepID=UPI001FB908BA|nr:hypothetical protein [Methylobacterium sp. E-016]MCJ2074246.1 hypothetical protein [Methylobacterium sp. E-016]
MTLALLRGADLNAEQEKGPRVQPEALDLLSAAKQSAGTHRNPTSYTKRVDPFAVPAQASVREIHRPSPVARIIAGKRRDQLTRVLLDTCGGPCRTSAAIGYLDDMVVLLRIACAPHVLEFGIEEWARLYTPELTAEQIRAATDRELPHPATLTSKILGKRWQVTEDQWVRLGLTHVWAAGWTRAIHGEKVRARTAANLKGKRLTSGVTKRPHELSATRTQPWIAAGFKTRRIVS